MAKTSTTNAKPAAKPAQPWAKPAADADKGKDGAGAQSSESGGKPTTSDADKPADNVNAAGGNGGGTDANADAGALGVIQSTEDVPESDGPMPGADSDDVDIYDTHGQAERLEENDVASTGNAELPSFVRDQISPSGIDISLEADRSERPPLDRSAFPSLGERLYAMLGKASDEQMAEFEERMADLAEGVIAELRANDQSEAFNNALVDPSKHSGPRVRTQAAVDSAQSKDAGPSNAERNRRARRAAERIAQAAKPSKR